MSAEQQVLRVIDLDETLFNTGRFFEETVIVSEEEHIVEAAVIREARARVEASGGSFDTMGFLRQQGASDEEVQGIAAILGRNGKGIEYLYPDSHDFLEAVDATGDPSIVATWGEVLTQIPKLQASGLIHRPYLITPHKKKGELINSWRTTEGLYRVQAAAGQILTAGTASLYDDKARSFEGLPEDCDGTLVQRKPPKPSQYGTVPPQVVVVPDLTTVTAVLKSAARLGASAR